MEITLQKYKVDNLIFCFGVGRRYYRTWRDGIRLWVLRFCVRCHVSGQSARAILTRGKKRPRRGRGKIQQSHQMTPSSTYIHRDASVSILVKIEFFCIYFAFVSCLSIMVKSPEGKHVAVEKFEMCLYEELWRNILLFQLCWERT